MRSIHSIARAWLATVISRHVRNDRRAIIFAALASFIFHVAIIGIGPAQDTILKGNKSPNTTTVKFHIYTPPASQVVRAEAKNEAAQQSRSTSSRAFNSHRNIYAPKNPKAASEMQGPRKISYRDLFPSNDFAMEQDARGVTSATTGSFEPADEFESKPFAEKVRFIGNLIGIAKEVKDAISVPSAIRKSTTAGYARASLRRVGIPHHATWLVATVEGDPYFRAILYSTLLLAEDQSMIGSLLAGVSFDTIFVALEWHSFPMNTPQPPPRIDGNKITIIINELVPMPNLLTMPIGVNNERDKMEMRRLEQSPAFVRPFQRAIGR